MVVCTSAFSGRVSVERIGKENFEKPSDLGDTTNDKLHAKSPSLVDKIPKDKFCVDSWNTSHSMTETFERKTIPKKAGSGKTDHGGCRTGNAAALRSPQHDQFSWTALIWQHTKARQSRQALRVFNEMIKSGVKPSSYTFVAALKACSYIHDLESVSQIHAEVVKSGFESIVFVGNMLVDVYAKCGSLVDARLVFERMRHRNVVSWNAMISGYAHMGEGEEALRLYAWMQHQGGVPDGRTFVGALKACSTLATLAEGSSGGQQHCLEQVRAIHSDVIRSGSMSDTFVANMLVDVYAKCRSLLDARSVFDTMSHRTAVSWTAMILGYAQVDEGEVALQLYAAMQRDGVVPDAQAFIGALKACSSLTTFERAGRARGLVMKNLCLLDQVRAIHRDVVKSGSESNLFLGTMLVDVYAKCGSLGDARHVFDKMPSRNVVSWTAMILGYVQMEDGKTALQLYAKMQEEGVVPNERTYVAALRACGIVAALDKGKEIHARVSICRLGAGDSVLPGGLIDMYGKCGSMVDAQRVFDALPKRDILTWSALIAGYARQGESGLVFDLFERMKLGGIQPEAITFLSVLTVCSHVGLVDKGQAYFEAMSREYGVPPNIEHYTCMIDLLGRAGQLDKAMAMVDTMPFQPDGVVWRSVMSACKKWKNVQLGKQAFECAVGLDKTDAAAYVLMSNIYAAAHMLEDAKEIQTRRLTTGAWKKPGQSWWTDLGGTVHTFVVGDQQHPESLDIRAKVEDLVLKMKAAGYVAHIDSVLRDIPHDEKEDALCGHSERLAIAHALLKTPDGTTIRVVKNLRVCVDCHTAIALISKIEERTIVCRDATRFHVYKDGKCSCRGYW